MKKILATIMAASISAGAAAHSLDVEQQNYSAKPWKETAGDSSFAAPHQLKYGVMDSQAVFAWLDADDYDVFSFTVTPADIAQAQAMGFPSAMVLASAIPPACKQTKNNYPAVALVAPFGTAPVQDPAYFNLPFAVPPGHGVLPVYNTPALGHEERAIYVLPDHSEDDHGEEGHEHNEEGPLNLSWFLPNGCSVEPYFNCQQSDSLGVPVFAPYTTAYIVVWDPDGNPQDYTVNVGVAEENTVHNEDVEDFVRNNAHLHSPCVAPYGEELTH